MRRKMSDICIRFEKAALTIWHSVRKGLSDYKTTI